MFDDLNIMRYWCEDNQTDLDTFKKHLLIDLIF